jgi:hypothetical protein
MRWKTKTASGPERTPDFNETDSVRALIPPFSYGFAQSVEQQRMSAKFLDVAYRAIGLDRDQNTGHTSNAVLPGQRRIFRRRVDLGLAGAVSRNSLSVESRHGREQQRRGEYEGPQRFLGKALPCESFEYRGHIHCLTECSFLFGP